jgi:AcrR family transcriptional regulator
VRQPARHWRPQVASRNAGSQRWTATPGHELIAAGRTQPLRKDAAINRERLLVAARELFASRGLDVTLNDIAHHAGVGVGTAYRRFANKEEVIDALFEEGLQGIAALANEALAQPDAWAGLGLFLERSPHMQFGDRGLNQP